MKKIKFTKMVASGNDFVVIFNNKPSAIGYPLLAKKICDRKYGVGADGLLVLEKSKRADIRMRIFNADGSQAQMCGNGARCAALYSGGNADIETQAGIIQSKVSGANVKIRLTCPKNIKLDILLKINGRIIKVNFIDTGVPHTVIFSEGLGNFDILPLGRSIRFHKSFLPAGTNVDFAQVLHKNSIRVRTYERGVEDETLACGTGSVAAALIFAAKSFILDPLRSPLAVKGPVFVHTQGKEILKVYFERVGNRFINVWLEGRVRIVYQGVYNV